MCQGVIFVFDSRNNTYHWGTGSHSNLIYRQFNTESPKFYDKLVRVEARLSDGPGEFSVEGGLADDDQLALFKDKLLDKVGSPQKLAAYLKNYEDLQFEDSVLDVLTQKGRDEYYALVSDRPDDWNTDKDLALALHNGQLDNVDEYRWLNLVYNLVLIAKGIIKKPVSDDKLVEYFDKAEEKQAVELRKKVVADFAKQVESLTFTDLTSGGITDAAYDIAYDYEDHENLSGHYNDFDNPEDFLEGKELTAYKKLVQEEAKRLLAAHEKKTGNGKDNVILTEADAFAKVVTDRKNIAANWVESWDADNKTVAPKKAKKKAKKKAAKKKTSKR